MCTCSAALILTAAALSATTAAFASGLRTYSQTVDLTFDTPEAAAQATLNVLPLPPGKSVAFSSRWDDTNPDHVKMVKTLGAHGCKGTFYLNSVNDAYADSAIRTMIESGCSIGAHTLKHPNLTTLKPNGIFKAIMASRIALESAGQVCVNSFTLPYCAYTKKDDPEMPRLIGECLIRSGLLGSPEYWPDVASRYGLSTNQWVGGFTFSIDDRNPNPERYSSAIAKGLASIEGRGLECGPHLVLGIHTWQKTDENFARLGEIVATTANRPGWWYCNESEYVAYRIQMLNSTITRSGVNGKTARFTLTRATPAELGDTAALGLKASAVPRGVSLDGGAAFATAPDGSFLLPHSATQQIPTRMAALGNPNNDSSLREQQAVPGLLLGLHVSPDKNTLCVLLKNSASADIKSLDLTIRLPPAWKQGVVRKELGSVKAGADQRVEFPLGDKLAGSDDPADLYFVAQCDVRDAAGAARIYLSTEFGAAP